MRKTWLRETHSAVCLQSTVTPVIAGHAFYRNIHDATLRRVVLGRARITPSRDGKMGVMLP